MRPTDANYAPTSDTFTMLGLDSFTTYFFQVFAYNSKGDGPGSNVVGPLSTPESGMVIIISVEEVWVSTLEGLWSNGYLTSFNVFEIVRQF